MIDMAQKINPRTWFFNMFPDPNSIIIPDGIPAPRDASSWNFPAATAWVADRWVISVAGTLPTPVGEVGPQDFIIRDGTAWTVIYAQQAPSAFIHRELWINVNEAEIPWKQYQSFANAFAYLDSIAGTPDEPSQFNRWAIRFNGIFNDTIDVPEFVHLVWDGRNTSWIMWGVNFLWDWGSVVSSISAYNCLLNIDQKDNWGWGWGLVSPVMINTNEIRAYIWSVFHFIFVQIPTSWSYGIDFFGTTINLPFNATAIDIENSIRSLLPKYANITVSWDYTTNFTIYLDWLPHDTNSWISIVDISLDVFSIKSSFNLGQPQIQQFAFSAIPTDWSFKVTYSYGWNNYEQIVLASDLIDNPTMTALFEWLSNTVQIDFPDYHISPRWYDYQTPTIFNVEFKWFGWNSDLIGITDNTLTYLTPWPVGQWADISLYNCVVFDAKTETASTLRMFDTDIYKWDFSGFDTIIMKWGKAWSSIWEIYFSPINNALLSEVDLQTQQRKFFINNAELINCRLSWDFLIYWKNSIKQCVLDIKQILLNNWDELSLIQTDWNGAEFVVYAWAKLNIYGTSQIVVTKQWWEVSTYGDYYDGTISWLSSKNEKGAIDELAGMMNNLITMAIPLTWDGSPIDNAVEPRYIWDRYIDNLWPTVYTAYNTTFNDRIS